MNPPTHCRTCGYEFADGMICCPYCATRRAPKKAKTPAAWQPCHHEGGAYADHCTICAPFWEKYPICPRDSTRLQKSGYCRTCRKYYNVEGAQ